MSESVSKDDLAAFFGSKAPKTENVSTRNPLSDQNRKDLVKEYYAKTNQSLVMRIHRLEVDLANSRKLVEQLRSENFLLKQKLSDSENRVNGDEIEALVNERVKRKMDRIGYISRRAIAFLQKTAVNLKDAYEDLGIALEVEADSLPSETSETRCRLSSLVADGEPRLDPVSESPRLDLEAVKAVGKNNDMVQRFQGTETPACSKTGRGPRRSELFRPPCRIQTPECEEDTSQLQAEPSPNENVAACSLATPLALPRRSVRPILDTPAVPWLDTDTVRRKRTATLKIKTMAEPKLNSKLRRPGRNDEPHPFITSMH